MLDILVVEDEAPIRDWIAYTISNISTDFNVVASASNGKEAYELAINLKPQVIISDIKMPIMGGIELTKEIKKIFSDIYIVLLTNYAEFSYAKEAISCGVYEYLIKSDIRPKELKEVLEKIQDLIITKNNEIKEINDNNNNEKYSKSVNKAIEYITKNYKEHISLQDISSYVYLSHEYFSRLFKDEVGENFSSYLTNYRMKKAEKLLKTTDMKIAQVAIEVGYSNASYFSKSYKKYKGISPEEDR
ncbi:MAG: response regulator transcription factor [Paraclostridium sp.]|uniref:response regulator transcription factor n=1 Tax=Paraclostridium sp. TaxID=2023273 RepID=UPI003F408495